MSFADFDDIYRICCDWEIPGLFMDEVIMEKLKEEANRPQYQQVNNWWEAAEREIKAEREKILM